MSARDEPRSLTGSAAAEVTGGKRRATGKNSANESLSLPCKYLLMMLATLIDILSSPRQGRGADAHEEQDQAV